MAMGVNLPNRLHSVHLSLQVEQVLADIYEGGAIRTAGAKVMPFTTPHACELKCWGDATLRRRPNLPATCVSRCSSTGSAAGSGTPLSSSPHPGWCFIHISRSPYCVLHHCLSFSPASRCPLYGCRHPGASLSGSPCYAALCVPGSLLHIATARAMPRESGLHASKLRNMASISQKVRGPG